MADKFRDVEAAFEALRGRLRRGEITSDDYLSGLKQLRFRDDQGRFWMIGLQSGQWYYYNGRDWVQAQPPSFAEKKAICIYCGFENDLEAETCGRCGGPAGGEEEDRVCPECGTRLDDPSAPCPACGESAAPRPAPAEDTTWPTPPSLERPRERASGRDVVVHSVGSLSFVLFGGAVGVAAGLLAGLLVGVTSLFPGFVQGLPSFFIEIQGKLWGGLIFAALGAVLGFLVFALGGLAVAVLINAALSFTGGLRVRLKEVPEEKAEDDQVSRLVNRF